MNILQSVLNLILKGGFVVFYQIASSPHAH
jgi:hypothetical protein